MSGNNFIPGIYNGDDRFTEIFATKPNSVEQGAVCGAFKARMKFFAPVGHLGSSINLICRNSYSRAPKSALKSALLSSIRSRVKIKRSNT
jgi:hypothetical protein